MPGQFGIVQKNNCFIWEILGLLELQKHKGIPLRERMSSVDVLGHAARCLKHQWRLCEFFSPTLFPCSLMWPSALWKCLTNSEGSGCIILRLTPQPLVFTQSCWQSYSFSALTLWENPRISPHSVNNMKVRPRLVTSPHCLGVNSWNCFAKIIKPSTEKPLHIFSTCKDFFNLHFWRNRIRHLKNNTFILKQPAKSWKYVDQSSHCIGKFFTVSLQIFNHKIDQYSYVP